MQIITSSCDVQVVDPEFLGRGRQAPKVGAPTYYLANFLQKLHENERNWTQGACVPDARPPPLRPTNAT